MNEEQKVEREEVERVDAPPRARVDDVRDTFERKRDYLEGFLAQKPAAETPGEPAESDVDETRRGSETTATRGPDGVIRRISRGIREAVIGNGESVASRTRSRAPDP